MSDETERLVIAFRDERDWKRFHNPKDLAISLSLEASELLELFQWRTSGDAMIQHRDEIADELADVFCYAISFADAMGFDIDEIIRRKLKKNAVKYPVEKAYGRAEKYTELEKK